MHHKHCSQSFPLFAFFDMAAVKEVQLAWLVSVDGGKVMPKGVVLYNKKQVTAKIEGNAL